MTKEATDLDVSLDIWPDTTVPIHYWQIHQEIILNFGSKLWLVVFSSAHISLSKVIVVGTGFRVSNPAHALTRLTGAPWLVG